MAWLARYLPGLPALMPGFDIRTATPAETRAFRRAGERLREAEIEFELGIAKIIASAAVGRRL